MKHQECLLTKSVCLQDELLWHIAECGALLPGIWILDLKKRPPPPFQSNLSSVKRLLKWVKVN